MANELTTVQQVMKRWKMHRNALLELVSVLPESIGTWRPWDPKYMETIGCLRGI